jgi:hypothetical protein
VSYHAKSQRNLSRECGPPALLKRRGCFFVELTMRVPNKNEGQCLAESESLAKTQPSLRHAFKHVYGFILQAVKGDKAAADAIFEDYLAGKLSEELLSISRRCVSADQASSSNREIEEGWGAVETIKSGSGAGVSEDALTSALS